MAVVALIFWAIAFYGQFSERRLHFGVHVFFMAQIMLYMISAWYHTVPETRQTRTIDQTMIGVYILAAALPVVFDSLWTVFFIGVSAIGLVEYKCRERRSALLQSLVFLGLGLISVGSILYVGGNQGPLFWILISLYIGKLLTHNLPWKPVPGYIEASEVGHPILAAAVVTNNVWVLGL